ncbi:hypothetical protein [Actinomadura nitritigenes]|uniref:MFS transporter n=1 Tax=Actinomadura nitritigenes TaxID=134602 RepID=A0ABS3RDC3_9ACTN|nr:hypothetical protein [Actinomadura nitritigenes]MBO2443872.1 hypothetical protein [Actinomadura nitritigenes]
MCHPAIEHLPPAARDTAPLAPWLAQILTPSMRRNTLLTWAGFFLVMFGFYFVTSWTSKLLVESGMSSAPSCPPPSPDGSWTPTGRPAGCSPSSPLSWPWAA